ncbi:MAG: transposase, partial [Clostridiales bacterium]|nr:transposase [Clostridiales bacterium]
HHVDEVLKLMTVLTKDERFENAQGVSEVGGVTMCEVLDKIVKEGEIKGKIEAYLDMNLTVNEIAQKVRLTVPEVEAIIASLPDE